MNPLELVEKLKKQHKILKADLGSILDNLNSDLDNKNDFIASSLKKFKTDLSEHLKFEQELLYPDFLEKNSKLNTNNSDTEKFIDQMTEIGVVVINFLKKYETVEAISNNVVSFKKELLEIATVLNVRIETEEEGIFDLYVAM